MSEAVLSKIMSCPTLPTLPAVALKVLELTRDPKIALMDIGRVVQADPALSAKMLKTVNSSVYGLTTPVTRIERAMSLLGMNAVKSLVLGFSLVESTASVTRGRGLDMQDHWRRATYAAAAARSVAQLTKSCDPDEAFTASIFQDIGVLAAFLALGDKYSDILVNAPMSHAELAEHENALMGITHAAIGAELASRWKLPDPYISAIRFHHASELSPMRSRDMTRVVVLGGQVADTLAIRASARSLGTVTTHLNKWFGIRNCDFKDLLERVNAGAQDLARIFEKDVGQPPDIAMIMAQASEQAMHAQMEMQRESIVLRQQNEQLAVASVTDGLTGVKNRKAFDSAMAEAQARYQPGRTPVAFLFCDADKFKSINDRFGHPAGDAVLKSLGSRLAAALGSEGEIYRYGGEEFVAMLPGAGARRASEIGEKLRLAIESPLMDLAGVPGAPATLPVTISVGVAASDGGAYGDVAAIVKAADEAVYRSKQVGRNCVTVHGQGTLSRPKVPACLLVLEDDPLACKLVQLAMGKKVGLELVVVSTCAEAHARLRGSWTAALVDVELPDGSGLEFIQAVRRAGITAPILSMSSNSAYRDEANRCGATQFVDKASFCRDLAKWVATLEQWANQAQAA